MVAVTKNRTYMVKLLVFGNNSKNINNIRNLTGKKWSAQQERFF
jgi:hypothetical protein